MQAYSLQKQCEPAQGRKIYFLRWRILDRIRRFLRPIFRRPLPVFLDPTQFSAINE